MIFLSHSWNEKPQARRLVEELARCGVPTWLDEQQLAPGALLRPDLHAAIAASNVYLYLVSAAANVSTWVQDELRVALAREQHGLVVVPVRLAGDNTSLPDLLLGRAYHDLDSTVGGAPKLAHELSGLPNASTLPAQAKVAATVRLEARRVVHTLVETSALVQGGARRSILALDDKYERIDDRYWRVAEQRVPHEIRGRPERLQAADQAFDSIHAQSRRAIAGIPALADEHAKHSNGAHSAYHTAAIERALFVLMHRLDWNVRYMTAWSNQQTIDQAFVNERDLADAFDGHVCEFVVDGRSVGKTSVPAYGHPWPDGMRLAPWPLSSPFHDLPEMEVGTAIGDSVAKRFCAGTTPTLVMPEPDKLLYGLG